jgi:peptidoglycan/LPS O-acetylase OafA/YrhL
MGTAYTKLPERNLDVLRAVAVLCVLADHVAIAATAPGNVAWGWLGRAGVLIFFVHTALVLMSSLERSGGERDDWIGRFYLRRAFRIYPLAIFAIFLVIALHAPPYTPHVGLVARYHAPDGETIFANILLAQNLFAKSDIIGVLWTLPIEVQMYLVLPLCFVVASRSVRGVLFLITTSAAVALAWLMDAPVPGLWRFTMLIYVPCFLGGVLAYALLRRSNSRQIPPAAWFAGAALLLAAFSALRSHYENVWAQWAFCLALGAAIPFGAELSESVVTRAAHIVAKYSYGVYLLHLPLLWIALVAFRGAPIVIQWLIFATSIVVVPWLVFQLIERPGIWLGQRIVRRPMPRQTPVGAP